MYAQKSHTPHTGDIPMIVQCTMYTVQCIYMCNAFYRGNLAKFPCHTIHNTFHNIPQHSTLQYVHERYMGYIIFSKKNRLFFMVSTKSPVKRPAA